MLEAEQNLKLGLYATFLTTNRIELENRTVHFKTDTQ